MNASGLPVYQFASHHIYFGGLDLFELKPFLSYRDMPNRIVLALLDLICQLISN